MITESRTPRIAELRVVSCREARHSGSLTTYFVVSVVIFISENVVLVSMVSMSVEGVVTFKENVLRKGRVIGEIKLNLLKNH